MSIFYNDFSGQRFEDLKSEQVLETKTLECSPQEQAQSFDTMPLIRDIEYQSLGLVFQLGLFLLRVSMYFFMAYSLVMLPSFFQVSHLYLSTTLSLLGALVLLGPTVACLNKA